MSYIIGGMVGVALLYAVCMIMLKGVVMFVDYVSTYKAKKQRLKKYNLIARG